MRKEDGLSLLLKYGHGILGTIFAGPSIVAVTEFVYPLIVRS
jgi:hypothetical protein